MDNSYKMSYTEFYHRVADLLIKMAEATLGLALFCSAKNILWPPVQFFYQNGLIALRLAEDQRLLLR
jgi:hypothetical protein